MLFSKTSFVSIGLALASKVSGYNDNCDGSSAACWAQIPQQCFDAQNSIDKSATYTDGQEFSHGHCYVVYATNGNGAQPISGQDIYNTMTTILNQCTGCYTGSYGTGNCDECHVTINYRA